MAGKTDRSVSIRAMIPISDIRAAAARIAGAVHRTPVLGSRTLGERAGVDLLLKCESLQKTGSFKPRGALNKVLSLEPAERARGLVTVSAGNHAQAVAWAAKRVGVPCAVVMPDSAPRAKLEAVRGYGAEVILHADRTTLFDRLREVERSGRPRSSTRSTTRWVSRGRARSASRSWSRRRTSKRCSCRSAAAA